MAIEGTTELHRACVCQLRAVVELFGGLGRHTDLAAASARDRRTDVPRHQVVQRLKSASHSQPQKR